MTLKAFSDESCAEFGEVSGNFSNLIALKQLTCENCGVRALNGTDQLASLKYMQVNIIIKTVHNNISHGC